jgi:hypothetical protein
MQMGLCILMASRHQTKTILDIFFLCLHLFVQLKTSGSHSFSFAGLILHRHQRKSYGTLSIDMSSKAGADDTWQSQTSRHSSAKGSERMGMAYCISF